MNALNPTPTRLARHPHIIRQAEVSPMVEIKNRLSNEGRLRREVGLFRERFQSLSTILQDLQGPRSSQAVLRSAQAIVASTVGADAIWLLDGRMSPPRPLLRTSEGFPAALAGEIKHCMRSARIITVNSDDKLIYLVPLQAGLARWGAMAVRIPTKKNIDSETLRFLSLVASLIGSAAALWESRAPKGFDVDAGYKGWLSLASLPSRCILFFGEPGTGKSTLAERMHDRYIGGGFASLHLTGVEEDEREVTTTLKLPGLRTIYVHDAVRSSPASRAALLKGLESNAELVLFLGSSESLWPIYPDALLSRAALVTIRLPALRERSGDIPSLVQAGLGERGVKVRLSSTAKQLLSAHAWPGNYDELTKLIGQAEQALRLEGGLTLTGQLTRRLLGDAQWVSLPALVDTLEGHVLAEALRRFDGNRAAVGRALEMTSRQVSYKCEKYGLE